MARTTRQPTKAPPPLSERFPYNTEFDCPECGGGFALDEGDAWGLTAVDGDRSAAVARCPQGCKAFAIAVAGRGEVFAPAPDVLLVMANARPAPAPPPKRPIERVRDSRYDQPDPDEDEETPGGGDDTPEPLEHNEADNPFADLGVGYYRPTRPPGLPKSVTYEDMVASSGKRERMPKGMTVR